MPAIQQIGGFKNDPKFARSSAGTNRARLYSYSCERLGHRHNLRAPAAWPLMRLTSLCPKAVGTV